MTEPAPGAPGELILDAVEEAKAALERLCIGLTWTTCATGQGLGFAMSPGAHTRVLSWPGTVAGRPARDVAGWLTSWNPFEATVGLAAANALINAPGNDLMEQAVTLASGDAANLAVFEYFRPRLEGRKVVVIGRYPGLDRALEGLDLTVLERNPGEADLPDPAAEFVLPEADWVFLTATSLINKTFARLATLARDAVTVLLGPSTPWLAGWAEFGIDFLAGVQVVDPARAEQIAAEGGGTRLFGEGVRYAVADIGAARMRATESEIAATVARRDALKAAMSDWYDAGHSKRFPQHGELETLDAVLPRLDTRYKRLWDARRDGSGAARSAAPDPVHLTSGSRQRSVR